MMRRIRGLGRTTLLSSLLIVLASALATRRWWWPGMDQPQPLPLPNQVLTAEPLAVPRSGGPMRFVRLSPEQTGVDHILPIDTSHPMKYLYFSGTTGGGVAVGDIDQDDRPDLFLVNGPGRNRLYRQTGTFRFEDITELAGIDGGDAWGTGASMVDINNDGRLDIYVCNFDSPNELYVNLGGGRFREMAASYGLNLTDACMMGVFSDYDRDGDLDCYILTYRYESPRGRPRKSPVIEKDGRRQIQPRYAKYYKLRDDAVGYEPTGRADGLLRNNGDGTFTDVTADAGIRGWGHGLSATWWDYNRDGWPDLYVANDFMDADQLLRNNGDGTFTDVIADTVPHTTWYSMGADLADLDEDGHLDLLVADMSGTTHYKQKTSMGNMGDARAFLMSAVPRQYMRNALLLSTGTPRFREAAYLAGLADSDWTWTVKMVDMDNDGHCDVFFTNGSPRDFTNSDIPFSADLLVGRTNWDLYEDTPPRKERNLAFRNQGDLQFADVSSPWGLDHLGISLAAAHADLDGDGDLDMVVVNLDEPVSILRNDAPPSASLEIRLVGVESNRFGLGATVQVETESGRQIRTLGPYTGFLASNQPIVHFGLGSAPRVETLTIHWPSGIEQTFHDLAVNQRYTIRESGKQKVRPAAAPEPLFRTAGSVAAWRHQERVYDDFERQPLLPNRLSQLGPGMAWGDADGDGDEDLYVGGAAGQAPGLLIQQAPGSFQQMPVGALDESAEYEDMGALWFDLEGDGDLDLYVVSGGYEFAEGDPLLGDRLYINQGDLAFTRAGPEVLPPDTDSGSVVTAADWDRDGDLDLFVGARMIPGRYPLGGRSRLLRNDQSRLADASDQLGAGADGLGMVTAALWSDVNSDGWQDLLVTAEWGPVRCLINQQGTLVDQTAAFGIEGLTGWWNGIAGGDIDHDGDMDYVVTNFGLNTKYHASKDFPALLYYGDFEGDGEMHLVEAEFEDQTLYPVRGKSCSTAAMPGLAGKFPTFHAFAAASLQDIYSPAGLERSYRFAATELRSGILRNEQGERFTFQPLPRIAQIAPSFGAIVADLNGDRHLDLFLAQNFYSPQPETGRMAGGLGQVLLGDGRGGWEPLDPEKSGVWVPQDAKSATVADITGDGLPDLLVGNNNAPLAVLVHHDSGQPEPLRVRLEGPSAIGARLCVRYADGLEQVMEVHAGEGYLSQSPPHLFFSRPSGTIIEQVEVVWPDGRRTVHAPAQAPGGVWTLGSSPAQP